MWTQCWLEYNKDNKNSQGYSDYFSALCIEEFNENEIIANAIKEVKIAAEKLFSIKLKVEEKKPKKGIVLKKSLAVNLGDEGYHIYEKDGCAYIEGASSTAILYGVYRFIVLIKMGAFKDITDIMEIPQNSIRMLNHWDNMDGSIERGYSGNSFFYEKDDIIINERTIDYARFLASIGINAVAINNVNVKNAAIDLVNPRFLSKVAKLSDIFTSYGVKMYISLNYAMPCEYEPGTADPLEVSVKDWWAKKMDEVYTAIPKLGGFLVKADSEGRPGPFTYGRTQADGANMLAEAIRPHGGLIIWRCFVYNCQQDWRDLTIDRAKAGFDYFSPLDGQFADNVILQIKNGPMDFQVREAFSPLFGRLKATNQMLEVQIAQEYTGHQIDVCYLIPWFKEILNFDTHTENCNSATKIADVVSGRTFRRKHGGMVAVTNTGNDENWTGHDLAAANLYGFGRLSFDTGLSAEEIAREWVKLTFQGVSEKTENIIVGILMKSWPVYESYTSPLGIGWMVTPDTHYGPSIDGYEYSRWGTYHRADRDGLGVERGPQGTNFTGQYNNYNKEMYENIESCPDELLLFFHKVNYTHVLHSGKTVIQHIYDSHFEGKDAAKQMQKEWLSLKGEIDETVFLRVAKRMEMQVKNAEEWCDIVNSYFYRKSGIADEKGRKIY